jgi:hypothetical protein
MAKRQRKRKPKRVLHQESIGPTPLWRKVPRWAYGLVIALSLVITALQGYPWLTIAGGARLNPNNPFSEIFNVTNEGYIPITDPHIDCVWHWKYHVQGWPESSFNIAFTPGFPSISFVGHGAKFSAPCYDLEFLNNPAFERPLPGSSIDVKVSYAYWPINLRWLRRSQTFHLKTVGKEGSQQWEF